MIKFGHFNFVKASLLLSLAHLFVLQTAIPLTMGFIILQNDKNNFCQQNQLSSKRISKMTCFMSLKPAAIPLMDSGKALAQSGELLIDLTSKMEIYGGGLSAAGASIRNSGDYVAQAAASCRFKTGTELVSDQLREGGDCLKEASLKLKDGAQEAKKQENNDLASKLTNLVNDISYCGESLEAAGAYVMQKVPVPEIGNKLVDCGKRLEIVAQQIGTLITDENESDDGTLSQQRMIFASQRMIEAGYELTGAPKPKPKGKSWLKSG